MFAEEKRKVFKYQVDGKDRWGDPLAIERKLHKMCGTSGRYAELLVEVNEAPVEVAFEAMAKLSVAVVAAFGLGSQPFDPDTGEGVMEREWMDTFLAFLEWQEKNDSGSEASPTPSAPSEPTSSDSSPTSSP